MSDKITKVIGVVPFLLFFVVVNMLDNENEIIQLVQNGNSNEFEKIVVYYNQRMMKLALRITRNQDDANEALQDAFMNAFDKLKTFKGTSSFESWLYRIVANAALMKVRARTKHAITNESDKSNIILQYTDIGRKEVRSISLRQELREAFYDALSTIPPDYKEIFILRDIDDISNQEICEILGASISSIKSKLHRARTLMRKRLKPLYEDYASDDTFYEIDDFPSKA